MHILLINHYAGSPLHGMEYRPYYLAREWTQMGHVVTIAAASVSHVRTVPPLVQGDITQELIDGIRYVWFRTPGYNGNGIARVLNIFSFIIQLLRHRKWLVKTAGPDVVIASSTYPLDIVPALAIARAAPARLVFEVHDLWPLSPIELGGMSRYHPFIVLMQWAENFAYRHADKVVSMLPKTVEHMSEHGMQRAKFTYVPNGVNVPEWAEPDVLPGEIEFTVSTLKAKGHFLVGYAGAHGLANALQHFIDAADQLQAQPVTFVLVGQGPEKPKLLSRVQERRQTNVVFLPPVARESIPALLHAMDGLYIGLPANPLFRFGVSPNKLMDYMMAARPVIYAIQAGNDMVAESGCGISILPESPDEIVAAVLRLMNLPQEARERMGQRGKDYILANHNYETLAQQFLYSLAGTPA